MSSNLVISGIICVLTILTVIIDVTEKRKRKGASLKIQAKVMCGILIALLATVNVYLSDKNAKEIATLQINKEVMAEISKMMIPAYDNYMNLLVHSTTLKNYLEYKRHQPPIESLDWDRYASPHLKEERDACIKSFNKLQEIAKEILALNMRYGNHLPPQSIKWANFTLSLSLNSVINVLEPNQGGMEYAYLTGETFSFAAGKHLELINQIQEK